MELWAVQYVRPDGWWLAGDAFESAEEAAECAREQLPSHVGWRVLPCADLRPDPDKREDVGRRAKDFV